MKLKTLLIFFQLKNKVKEIELFQLNSKNSYILQNFWQVFIICSYVYGCFMSQINFLGFVSPNDRVKQVFSIFQPSNNIQKYFSQSS